jgi:hypothetical protein
MVKASIKGFTSDSFKAYIDGLSKLNLVTNTKQMELNIDGSSNVSYTGSTSRLTVKLDGVSTFSSSGLNLSNLELDLDGMSKAELTGRSEMVNAEVFGSSKLLAYNLIADQIDIDLDGASRAEVNASKILNIKSDGVSKIYYKGDPQITKNIGGLSDAENIQLEESDLQDTGDGRSFIVNKLSTTSNDNVIQVK